LSLHEDIERAAAILRAGGVVAFPTETVYGLGADAENAAAVARVFAIKARPPSHPVIVHVADAAALDAWCTAVPDVARRLAERFWPGPLTLILRRRPRVPDVVTGGLDTVGIRVPRHDVALALLRGFGGGMAAPSANRYGRISPTTAGHVHADLGRDVDFVLDGGPCPIGVESTIVDVSSGTPALLRPGGVTPEELEEIVGGPVPLRAGGPVRSPGQQPQHYAPRARVVIVEEAEIGVRAAALLAEGRRVAVCARGGAHDLPGGVEHIVLDPAPADTARGLYAALREVDRRGCDVVLVTMPEEIGLGVAIADRLRRAAGLGAGAAPSGGESDSMADR
jgi:L-threonylcarbamoyladenylate synthase